MNDYELVLLLHPDLEIDLDKPVKKIEKIIADNGGKITKKDNWGKRKLAYTIRKEDFAVYLYYEVALPPLAVGKLDGLFNITDEILRHLITAHVEVPLKDEDDKKSTDKASEAKVATEEK